MTQTYQPQPPPQAQPKKKRGVLKWILIGLGILVALIVVLGWAATSLRARARGV
jgi:flagellar basal body-associated protein FliL